MSDCVFCRIAQGSLPADILHEDEHVIAFSDRQPQAPFHGLVIPRRHIATLNDLSPDDIELAGRMLVVAAMLARRHGFDQSGYRSIINCNRDGGQVVYHLHLHVLGGGPLRGAMG